MSYALVKTANFYFMGVPRIFHWGQYGRADGRELGGSWGGAATPSPPTRGSGERYELPSGVRGGAATAQRFSTIFSTQDGLSWHYNIVNYSDVNKDWTCKDKDKDFTYSYLLQVAANPTIAIKQQQWTQSESSQHMTVQPITLNK